LPRVEVIQKQLARLPTRRELAKTALGIIFTTMMLTTLSFAVVSPVVDKSDAWCQRRGSDRGGERSFVGTAISRTKRSPGLHRLQNRNQLRVQFLSPNKSRQPERIQPNAEAALGPR
jgi:hypothetical protein